MPLGKVLIYQFQEFPPDVGFHVSAVWRVKPRDVSASFSFLGIPIPCILFFILYFFLVSASLKRLLVWGSCFTEYFLIMRTRQTRAFLLPGVSALLLETDGSNHG